MRRNPEQEDRDQDLPERTVHDRVGASTVPRGARISHRALARVDRTIFASAIACASRTRRGCGADPAQRRIGVALAREIAERHDARRARRSRRPGSGAPRGSSSARPRRRSRRRATSVVTLGGAELAQRRLAAAPLGETAHHEVAIRHDAGEPAVVAARRARHRRRIPSSSAPRPRPSGARSA